MSAATVAAAIVAVTLWLFLFVVTRTNSPIRDWYLRHLDRYGATILYLGIGKQQTPRALYVWALIVITAAAVGTTLLAVLGATGALNAPPAR